MDRRSFLGVSGAASALVAGSRPSLGQAQSAPSFEQLVLRASAIRSQMNEAGQRFRIRCDALPVLGEWDEPLKREQRRASLSRCFRGMIGYASLRDLSIEEQTHPSMQSLFEEVFHDVGGGVLELTDLLEELFETSPSAFDEILADIDSAMDIFGLFESELGVFDFPSQARDATYGIFRELKWSIRQRRFSKDLRRLCKKVRRLERKAERIIETGDHAAFGTASDATHRQAVAGLQRWGIRSSLRGVAAAAGTGTAASGVGGAGTAADDPTVDLMYRPIMGVLTLTVGALLLGVCVGGGCFLIGLGVLALACFCVGIPLIIAGLGLIAVGVGFVPKFFGEGQRMLEDRYRRRPKSYASVEQVLLRPMLNAVEEWRDSKVVLDPACRYYISATGSIRMANYWRAMPFGWTENASADSLMPDAAEGLLVGRVGETLLEISDRNVLPQGLSGPLELGINISESKRPRRPRRSGKRPWFDGQYVVRIFRL